FFIDHFQLIGPEGKMRIIEVAGSEKSIFYKSDAFADLLNQFAMYKHFARLGDGIFGKPALCLDIIGDGITDILTLSLLKNYVLDYGTRTVAAVIGRHHLGLLVHLHFWCG